MKKYEYMQNNRQLKYLSYLVNVISAPEPQRTASAHAAQREFTVEVAGQKAADFSLHPAPRGTVCSNISSGMQSYTSW